MHQFGRELVVVALVGTVGLLCVMPALGTSIEDTDYYQLLGVPETATEREIKVGYREMSKKYHPDVNNAADARERHTMIGIAYETLSDKKKRKMYDISGKEGVALLQKQTQMEHQGRGQDSFFSFFEGAGSNLKGKDVKNNVKIPLRDIYNGATHSLPVVKQVLCKKCKGTGAKVMGEFKRCTQCSGSGHFTQRIQIGPGMIQQIQQACPKCGGSGKEVKHKCTACKGTKVTKGESVLNLEVPRGIPENYEVKFEMEADQNPEQIPGDVILAISSTKGDSLFDRKGNDLYYTQTISLREALLGFTKTIVHMDGRIVKLEEHGVTQYGTVRKVLNEGMPILDGGKGDLYVTYVFVSPTSLTAEQEKLVRETF
eukprot:Tbor_TRINITY_DN2392_c0_g1::TRINITY_DN2392_c0_g1_i1::g.163::m.163/K14002/SCJ1; DnaJ-related protein SCJ1